MDGEGSVQEMKDAAEDALDLCRSLVERALAVVSGAPYWQFVGEKEWAQVAINGQEATLSWPEDETEWECTTIRRRAVSFPASLLFISDDELAFWKREQHAAYEREQAKRQAAEAATRERQERAAYEALKAKFG